MEQGRFRAWALRVSDSQSNHSPTINPEEILTMMLKTLTAATAAALLALSSVAFAQSSGTTGASGSSGSGVGASTDVPAKCKPLTGTEREKCLQDERAGAGATGSGSAGGGTSGSTSGGMSGGASTSPTPTPAPAPTTPGSGEKKQ
jgi:hypothetical protein